MHSLVSSQEIAVCHQGNWPKTRALFCRYIRVFRNLVLAGVRPKQTLPVAGSCSSLVKPMSLSLLGVSKSNLMLVSLNSDLGLWR